ncbi:MAG TPA: hypothetical protein EYP36_03810 [Calditrichaeota bacterium]|nr:hypothetical protein [Calditrichota bacterium]
MIESDCYCDVAFEALEQDSLSVIQHIYQTLGFDHFEQIKANVLRYLEENSNYKKNIYKPIEPVLLKKINENWERSFYEWGYKIQQI